jgi:TonB family protein
MIALASGAPGSLARELRQLAEPSRRRGVVAVLVALMAHLGLATVAARTPHAAPPPPPPVDVELAFREPPPEPPPPPPEPVEAEAPKPAPAPKPVAARPAPPPPAAKAGAVLTAAPDPAPTPGEPEPFDFTSDPNSHVYGSGVVAVGGTATHGLDGARVGGTGQAPAPSAKGDGLTPASDLSQKPRLTSADPCRGYFPPSAHDDVASVSVRVVIGKNGSVSNASVVSESPAGQGFGTAAQRCMRSQTFVPALDRAGNAAATALNVNVRFSR